MRARARQQAPATPRMPRASAQRARTRIRAMRYFIEFFAAAMHMAPCLRKSHYESAALPMASAKSKSERQSAQQSWRASARLFEARFYARAARSIYTCKYAPCQQRRAKRHTLCYESVRHAPERKSNSIRKAKSADMRAAAAVPRTCHACHASTETRKARRAIRHDIECAARRYASKAPAKSARSGHRSSGAHKNAKHSARHKAFIHDATKGSRCAARQPRARDTPRQDCFS